MDPNISFRASAGKRRISQPLFLDFYTPPTTASSGMCLKNIAPLNIALGSLGTPYVDHQRDDTRQK